MQLIVSTVLGVLSGLGIGGGSLMLLWLTAGMGMEPETARRINLLYYIPTALIAVRMRGQRQLAPKSTLRIAAAAGIAGTAAGTLLRRSLSDGVWLHKAMGVLFLVTGVRELCYRDRELR